MTNRTEYEKIEGKGTKERRLLRQEELILEVAEAASGALEEGDISRAELAERLEKSRSFVSQILAGDRNFTLRTLADLGDALDCRIRIGFVHRRSSGGRVKIGPWGENGFKVVRKDASSEGKPRVLSGGAA